jgi:hypothetical protein
MPGIDLFDCYNDSIAHRAGFNYRVDTVVDSRTDLPRSVCVLTDGWPS